MATEPATDRQREGLQKWGVAPAAAMNPALSKKEASDWMDELSAVSKGTRPNRPNLHHVPTSSALPVPVEAGFVPRAAPPASGGSTDLATLSDAQLFSRYGCTRAQYEVVRNHIARGLNPDQLDYLLSVGKMRGLSPWAKQIYAMVYKSRTPGKPDSLVLQTGIDGYTAIAHRSGLCDGIEEPEFEGEENSDGVLHPKIARVRVWRKGASKPFVAVARWSEYRKVDREGKASDFWLTMPYGQLGKCALSRAIRLAFPEYVGGIFTHEEMAQATSEDREVRVDVDGGPAPPPLTPEAKAGAIDVAPTPSPPAGGNADSTSPRAAPTPGVSPAIGAEAGTGSPAPKPAGPRTLDPDPVDLVNLVQEILAASHGSNAKVNAARAELINGWCAKQQLKDLMEAVNPEKGVSVGQLENLRSLILDAGVTA